MYEELKSYTIYLSLFFKRIKITVSITVFRLLSKSKEFAVRHTKKVGGIDFSNQYHIGVQKSFLKK